VNGLDCRFTLWQKLRVQNEGLVPGRRVRPEEVGWLRDWIHAHPQWSRKRLARELCQPWQWRDACGRLKDFAARSFLLKLEAQGRITLPPLQVQQRRARPSAAARSDWQEPTLWSAELAEVSPVSLAPVRPGTPPAQRWAFYLHRYHYLGGCVVGENLGYLAQDAHGRDVGCLLFGAPAGRCAPRDRALGWTEATRRERLHTLANNTRFLILPWVIWPATCWGRWRAASSVTGRPNTATAWTGWKPSSSAHASPERVAARPTGSASAPRKAAAVRTATTPPPCR